MKSDEPGGCFTRGVVGSSRARLRYRGDEGNGMEGGGRRRVRRTGGENVSRASQPTAGHDY